MVCVVIVELWVTVSVSKAIDAAAGATREVGKYSYGHIGEFLPFWLFLTLAAIPTAILWHRDRRRVKPGCCKTCGYDLRASKKICPECGTAIPARPRNTSV